jgi:DNA-binding response OmpR family regulator
LDKLLSGRRLLVVEDEMLVLLTIEDMLADLGCEAVSSAATVKRAVALIEAKVFDAAMLDMNLNGDNSHAIAEALRARQVPFLVCTGNTGRDLSDVFRNRAVLRKPFSFEALAAALTELLRGKARARRDRGAHRHLN